MTYVTPMDRIVDIACALREELQRLTAVQSRLGEDDPREDELEQAYQALYTATDWLEQAASHAEGSDNAAT